MPNVTIQNHSFLLFVNMKCNANDDANVTENVRDHRRLISFKKQKVFRFE